MTVEEVSKIATLTLDLAIWIRVNASQTLEELAEVIESAADEEGMIQGRREKFSAQKMANLCRSLQEGDTLYTTLTRNYGIRQQAIYIMNKHKYKA